MQKVVFDTWVILDEFLTRADMRWFTLERIRAMLPIILEDKFRLILVKKRWMAVWNRIYISEWVEDGKRDSDEWVRPYDRFPWAVAESYIQSALKLPE
jgi:hypothetical protein